MKMLCDARFVLILFFLTVIVGVSLVQTAVEALRGEWPQALDIFRRRPTTEYVRSYERNLEEASVAAEYFRPWVQQAQFSWFHDGGEKVLVGRDGWLFYRQSVQYATERAGVRSRQTTASEAVTAIVAFRDQLAARGIQLVVVPAPNKESVYPEKLTARSSVGTRSVCAATQAVLRELESAEVEVVDLFDLFAEAKASPANSNGPLYLAQDSHWSPEGAKLAAQAVARRILERGWIQIGATTYRRQSVSLERHGDLLQMLQLPAVERDTKPEHIECVRMIADESAPSDRDDLGSEVLVLGDSFLRIYQTDEPGAAGFLACLESELKQSVASIVNDGGASTLVRQELHRRSKLLTNKKVVVWEFVERDITDGAEGWQVIELPQLAHRERSEFGNIPLQKVSQQDLP